MIATLLSLATSRLTGPIALAGCAVLSMMLIGAKVEVHGLRSANSEYHRAIHDPINGWKARLDTCHANNTRLEDAVAEQNAKVDAAKAEGDRMAAAAKKAASEARKAQGKADALAAKMAGFQAGKTCEEREGNVVRLIEGMG